MREAGHEQQVGAAFRHRIVDEGFVGVRRDRACIRRRLQHTHLRGLVLAGIQHRIDAPPDRALARLHCIGGRAKRIAFAALRQQCGLVAHAAEMQVVAVVGDTRARQGAHRIQVRLGHVGTRQQHRIEQVGLFAQQRTDTVAPARAVVDLHTHRLQARRIHRIEVQVVRPELHHRAGILQRADEGEHGARAGIAIRLRHVV